MLDGACVPVCVHVHIACVNYVCVCMLYIRVACTQLCAADDAFVGAERGSQQLRLSMQRAEANQCVHPRGVALDQQQVDHENCDYGKQESQQHHVHGHAEDVISVCQQCFRSKDVCEIVRL